MKNGLTAYANSECAFPYNMVFDTSLHHYPCFPNVHLLYGVLANLEIGLFPREQCYTIKRFQCLPINYILQ